MRNVSYNVVINNKVVGSVHTMSQVGQVRKEYPRADVVTVLTDVAEELIADPKQLAKRVSCQSDLQLNIADAP